MNSAAKVRLPDVAQIVMGQSPPGDSYNEVGQGMPFFQGKSEFGKISPTVRKWCTQPKKVAEAGDILISVRAPVGPTNLADVQCCIGRGLAAIRADSNVLLQEYLRYALRKAEPFLASMGQGSTFAAIGRAELEKVVFPMPQIDEQRRIVDLISRAESIVRLRRDAKQKAAELGPSIFLEMFGDPTTNPKGWPSVKLGDYLSIESTVRTPNPVSDASLPCIGADSIESGSGKTVSWPNVEQVKPISGKYHFEKNDVLYSKIRPALRKAIVAPESGYCSADMYPLRPKSGIATPEYVAALLLSKAFTEYAIGVSARAQMPKVNRETLFAYEHPMPPITLQEAFAKRMQDVNSIQRQQESALGQSELVFASLLEKMFS
ncbi:HsdS Restriction endonuclease S subunits [Comamonadaceae bacterium]